jgi:hypothetical protein
VRLRRHECPVFFPMCALFYPGAEEIDLLAGQRRRVVRHPELGVVGFQSCNEFRSSRFARHDGASTRHALSHGLFAEHEGDAALLAHTAVTGGAALGEYRADVAVEVDRGRRRRPGAPGQRGDQTHGHAVRDCAHSRNRALTQPDWTRQFHSPLISRPGGCASMEQDSRRRDGAGILPAAARNM